MQLTTQMQAEIETIRTRVDHICHQVCVPLETEVGSGGEMLPEYEEIVQEVIEELNSYKVRLENILCETDEKEHVRSNYSDF